LARNEKRDCDTKRATFDGDGQYRRCCGILIHDKKGGERLMARRTNGTKRHKTAQNGTKRHKTAQKGTFFCAVTIFLGGELSCPLFLPVENKRGLK
jgi:hypothetical protein